MKNRQSAFLESEGEMGFARLMAILVAVIGSLTVVPCKSEELSEHDQQALTEVARIHGEAGPFVTAGYRIGERALRELETSKGSFSLEVTHYSPLEVQFGCVADGLQAATGVSAGKFNLKIEKASREDFRTVVRNKKTGKMVTFRFQPKFIQRYLNQSPLQARKFSEEILKSQEDEIFRVQSF